MIIAYKLSIFVLKRVKLPVIEIFIKINCINLFKAFINKINSSLDLHQLALQCFFSPQSFQFKAYFCFAESPWH